MKTVKRTSNVTRETKRLRKLLNKEVSLGIQRNSDSETEDVDLNKELYPLSHYINNREEMIDQMFSIIKGDKLTKMLPPILKDLPMDELKADCLIHLLGMSKKRIIAILEGKEIDSSSDSETHSDSPSPCRKTKPIVKPISIKQEGCSDISDNSEDVILIEPDQELHQSLTSTSKVKKSKNKDKGKFKSKKHIKQSQNKNNSSGKKTKTKTNKDVQVLDKQISEQSEESQESSPHDSNEEKSPKEGKTLLEILELEMRARAIRALLHKNDTPGGETNINTTETPSKTVPAEESNKITQQQEFRKKKRKNDDVIVITPKVVTIDLTDESDISNAKKPLKESIKNKKFENRMLDDEQKKDNATNNLDTTNRFTTSIKNMCSGLESGWIGINEKKGQGKSKALVPLPAQKSEQSNLKKSELQRFNWTQRWLESKEVKKVVSTSKICGNIRKRIKNAKLAKQNRVDSQVKTQEIHGSVDEYQLLSKSSKLSDLKDKPLEVCNSESSLIYNDGGSGKFVESKTIEQVQDVSSTKNEPSTDLKHLQESVVCDSKQENIFGGSSCHVHSSSTSLDSGVIDRSHFRQITSESKTDNPVTSKLKTFDADLVNETILNNPEKIQFDSGKGETRSLQGSDRECDNKQSELDNTNCKEQVQYLELSSKNFLDSNILPSPEEIIHADHSINKELKCAQFKMTTNSNEDIKLNSNLSVLPASDESVKGDDLNTISPENNEPETLVINISEEDRNID